MPSLDLGKVVGAQGEPGPVAQGTMMETTYDPQGKARDVFAYADAAAEAAEKSAAAGAEKKANEAKEASAPITHASRHESGGADPITPGAIGAVKKTGDTMTGHLTLSVPNYTQIMLDNTGAGSRVKIQNGGHYAYIGMQDASADSNQRQIIVRDKTNKDGIKEALQLADIVNGSTAYYNVLHTGNKELISFSATVAVSSDWVEDDYGYSQTVAVSGILATDNPIADVVLGSDAGVNVWYKYAWERVDRVVATNGAVTLYANENPAGAFTMQLKVVR